VTLVGTNIKRLEAQSSVAWHGSIAIVFGSLVSLSRYIRSLPHCLRSLKFRSRTHLQNYLQREEKLKLSECLVLVSQMKTKSNCFLLFHFSNISTRDEIFAIEHEVVIATYNFVYLHSCVVRINTKQLNSGKFPYTYCVDRSV
jgi:hypothetical protein